MSRPVLRTAVAALALAAPLVLAACGGEGGEDGGRGGGEVGEREGGEGEDEDEGGGIGY